MYAAGLFGVLAAVGAGADNRHGAALAPYPGAHPRRPAHVPVRANGLRQDDAHQKGASFCHHFKTFVSSLHTWMEQVFEREDLEKGFFLCHTICTHKFPPGQLNEILQHPRNFTKSRDHLLGRGGRICPRPAQICAKASPDLRRWPAWRSPGLAKAV